MNESQMIERLLNAGVAAEEAESMIKAFAGAASTSTTNEESVDVDRLTKAMEGIKDAFDSEPDETPSVDAAIQEATDIVDAVTKGADALLAEHRDQFEALSKGIILLTQEVAALRGQVSSNGETVVKSLGTAAAALNEPVMRKSVSAGSVEEIPSPGEVNLMNDFHPQSLISKALDEIRGDGSTDVRKAELRKAISLLESGMAPASVAKTYSLSAQG
jgi:hypothetical protein